MYIIYQTMRIAPLIGHYGGPVLVESDKNEIQTTALKRKLRCNIMHSPVEIIF